MDHLTSDEERRARWYAAHLRPRHITVIRGEDGNAPCPCCCHSITPDVNEGSAPKCNPSPITCSNRSTDCLDSGHIVGIPASLFVDDDATKVNHGAELIRQQMKEYGFAVITVALSKAECKTALGLAWDYLEAASFVERLLQGGDSKQSEQMNNQSSTNEDGICADSPPLRRDHPSTLFSPYFPASVEGGILPFYGSGHSTFAWYIRDNAAIQSIFAAVYNVPPSELITSLDGMVIWRNGKAHRTDEGWFHIDQNPRTRPGFEAVQGLVNLLPVTQKTGANVLVAKSHELFPGHYVDDDTTDEVCDFYRTRLDEIDGDDWLEVDPNDSGLLNPKNVVMCLLGRGDVLLWDSRVVHCSYPGEDGGNAEDRRDGKDVGETTPLAEGIIRAAGLVAMMPRNATEEVLNERIKAVRSSRTLTHWANKAAPLGEERQDEVALERKRAELMRAVRLPNDAGNGAERNVLVGWDDLNAAQRRLVGC